MLILRSRVPFAQKPVGRVEVDWSHPLTQGLMACYVLNDHRVEDAAGLRQAGARTGALPVHVGGHRKSELSGIAYDFGAATSDRVEVGTWGFDLSVHGVTVEAWVWNDTYPDRDVRYVSKADGGNANQHDWMIGYTAAGAARQFRSRLGRTTSTLLDPADSASRTAQWIHVIGRGEQVSTIWEMDLFVDAVNVHTISPVVTATGATANEINIGNQPLADTNAPDGKIGLVVVWARGLSDAEILWRYREPWAFIREVPSRTFWMPNVAAGGGGGARPHMMNLLGVGY